MASQILVQILNGLVWGWVIALIAVGLNLIFGLLNIINMAHGAFYMLGAVTAWYLIGMGANFWLALALAPVLIALLGMGVEVSILRRLQERPVMGIIATFGLMLVLQQAVLLQFGGSAQRIEQPFQFQLQLGDFGYSGYRLFVAGCSLVLLGLLWVFLNQSKLGLWIRAIRTDGMMAAALGVPVPIVRTFTFGLGVYLAAISGILAAPIIQVSFDMGINIILSSFIVVIVGGVGNLAGSLLAALALGSMVGVASIVLPPTLATIVSLSVMALLLLWRPEGLTVARGR